MSLHEYQIKNEADAFDMWALCTAAKELAMGKHLFDPTDDDILIYAAELDCDVTVDLAKLLPWQRQAVIAAYDANV
jgi:hypothetical protein